MFDTSIIRTNEICLKGGNRGYFERKLMENIRMRAASVGVFSLAAKQGNIFLSREKPLSDTDVSGLTAALKTVFGIANFTFATRCGKTIQEMGEAAVKLLRGAVGSFKVETRRGDKSFPLKSPEVSRQVGGYALSRSPGARVDVNNPDLLINIFIDRDFAYVSAGEKNGPGGLPSGSSGKVVALLSSGIDSPVAAWKVMHRGCAAVFIHFHSYPYVGQQSIDKVRRLAAVLNEHQRNSKLYLVPFAGIQREITAKTDPAMRVVLYRRFMLRIANSIASSEGALGIVTGDSIGQVASQTLQNMAAISAVAALPIYRPLIGEDKNDIVAFAKRIGTYDISIEPHDDCCSLFLPDHPATGSTPARALQEENKLAAADLISQAIENTERLHLVARMEAKAGA